MLFLAFRTFGMTACPASELQEKKLFPQNKFVIELNRSFMYATYLFRGSHLFGSLNPVLVNLDLNEYCGNLDCTFTKSTCPGRFLIKIMLAFALRHLLLLPFVQW